MSKRNGQGDVLANQASLAQAKGMSILSSWLGPREEADSKTEAQYRHADDGLQDAAVEPEHLGVGGIAPQDIEDGSFTKRISSSDDKLLAQLIGRKRAKAHMAARQQGQKSHVKPKEHRLPIKTREESENEEEGKAAVFKSKRRKMNETKRRDVGDIRDQEIETTLEATEVDVKDAGDYSLEQKASSSQHKPNVTSFLDEMLAERSKKKKKTGSKKQQQT